MKNVTRLRFLAVITSLLASPPMTKAADSDGDGLPDVWEIAYALNPTDPLDACFDSDGDGFLNPEEFRAGADPNIGELFACASLQFF